MSRRGGGHDAAMFQVLKEVFKPTCWSLRAESALLEFSFWDSRVLAVRCRLNADRGVQPSSQLCCGHSPRYELDVAIGWRISLVIFRVGSMSEIVVQEG